MCNTKKEFFPNTQIEIDYRHLMWKNRHLSHLWDSGNPVRVPLGSRWLVALTPGALMLMVLLSERAFVWWSVRAPSRMPEIFKMLVRLPMKPPGDVWKELNQVVLQTTRKRSFETSRVRRILVRGHYISKSVREWKKTPPIYVIKDASL